MSTAPRQISVFDSTLRDGEQAPGNTMNPDQKLALALALEGLGVSTVETGFPSSSPDDYAATKLISEALTTAKFATLNRASRADIDAAAGAGGVYRHQLQIMATGSEIHLEHKRGISRADAVDEIADSFRHAQSLGFTDISLGIEDASRGDEPLLRRLVEAALANGGRTVVLADTTGCLLPAEMGDLVAAARSWVPDDVVVSVHCHNDLGLGLANALAAIQAGADEVQTTLAGIGERAGNTPLEELAAVLAYKGHELGAATRISTMDLYAAFQLLCRTIGPAAARNKPIFGENVFATQAGIHQAGMLRNPVTYEYAEPARFGRQRSILIGRHSGRNVIRHLLGEMGLDHDAELTEQVYQEHVVSRSGRDCIELDDLRRLVGAQLAATGTAR
jgi:2-isopropylmalate synthase